MGPLSSVFVRRSSGQAAGGPCSTVEDLLVWQRALVTGDAVGADSYERMTTPASLESGEAMTDCYRPSVGELEGNGGSRTAVASLATTRISRATLRTSLAIVVLVNTTPGHTGRIEDAVARAALGLARNVVLDLPLPPEENARYVGTHDLGRSGGQGLRGGRRADGAGDNLRALLGLKLCRFDFSRFDQRVVNRSRLALRRYFAGLS